MQTDHTLSFASSRTVERLGEVLKGRALQVQHPLAVGAHLHTKPRQVRDLH